KRRRQPMIASSPRFAAIRSVEHERPDSGGASRRKIGLLIANAPGTGKIETKIAFSLQQHARIGLPPGMVAAIGAEPCRRVIGAMVDAVDDNPAARELAAHPAHQPRILRLAIEAAADARLVGGDDDGKAAPGKGFGQLEDAGHEAAFLDAMEIARILVD